MVPQRIVLTVIKDDRLRPVVAKAGLGGSAVKRQKRVVHAAAVRAGSLQIFLQQNVKQLIEKNVIVINQKKYLSQILEKFGMKDCKRFYTN